MNKKSFTLIEILIVVILISIIYLLVLKLNIKQKNLNSNNNSFFLTQIKNKIKPYGFFLILSDKSLILIKNTKFLFDANKNNIEKVENIFKNINTINFYTYAKNGWKKENFGLYNGEKVVFIYQVFNNRNKTHGILEVNNQYYVIKPFEIKKFNSLKKASNYYFLINFQPYKGIL